MRLLLSPGECECELPLPLKIELQLFAAAAAAEEGEGKANELFLAVADACTHCCSPDDKFNELSAS